MTEKDLELVCSKIDDERDFLNSISHNIWKNPETKFEEVYAHDILTDALEKCGFDVKKSYFLKTAFRAEYSSGEGPTIAILLEYDALPGIGHACGHNLIAEAGLAAGIGVVTAMRADPSLKGKIVLLGTPAEESGGGKIHLIRHGAFEDIEVAMMAHPCMITCADPDMLGRYSLTVDFKGKESHASGFPWEGVNALDAAVCFYQSLGLLRQQTIPSCRIHAIITKGGTAINVIPADTTVVVSLRALTRKDLNDLKSKAENCFKGAALSTGCSYTAEFDEENRYEDLLSNKTMKELYTGFSEKLGLPETDLSTLSTIPLGSTDMGNVSHLVPSIHAFYMIHATALNHTKEFTIAAGSPEAQGPTLVAAKSMAMTALSLLRDPEKLARVTKEFQEMNS